MCANGLHEMTEGNIRHRSGDRTGWQECLACQRESWARRHRDNREDINRTRCLRSKARRLGLELRRAGAVFSVYGDGEVGHTGTFESVAAWLSERQERRPAGPLPLPIPAAWEAWIGLFVDEQRAAQLRPGTISTRAKHLVIFARRHPDCDPLTVTRADLVRYLGDSGWQPTTAHAVKSTFRVFFRTLEDLGHRTDDPTRSLPRVRVPRRLPRPCPEDVVAAACKSEDPRIALAVRIAAETGLRRCEVAALRRDDVHGPAGSRALVICGKGGHERTIPITDELAERLLQSGSEYIFPNPWGGPLSPSRFGAILRTGLPPGFTPHTLRHRFGTVVYQATGDIRVAQELLGHASPVTTAIYTQVSGEALRRGAMAAVLHREEL